MNRQVDVKALVSHIVRGDGADKCRICMGDTTDGQVYLGDTVMMDDDKPVTLSELLETVTGVEVQVQESLPTGLCSQCVEAVQAAAAFRQLCHEAFNHWTSTVQALYQLPMDQIDVTDRKSVYFMLRNTEIVVPMPALEYDIVPVDKAEMNSPNYEGPSDTEQDLAKPGKRKCPECGKVCLSSQHLYEHLMDSTDYKRACYNCAAIMTRDELVQHIMKDHNEHPYDCKKCPALCQSLKSYKKHMMQVHSSGSHSCGECGRSFRSKNAYHGHLSMHNAKNCPACDKLFRNHRCYLHHVKRCCNLDKTRRATYRTKSQVMFEVTNRKSEKKVKVGIRGSALKECICDYCGKTFAGKKFVCAHIQIVHMKNTHRPCPYCGKLLASAHMSIHLKKHEVTKLYTCGHCDSVMKTKLGYIQHIRLHTGEKPYACKYCPETFSASSRRSEHVRKVHEVVGHDELKHACKQCPARFRLPYRLKRHIATAHETLKDGSQFECAVCHIKFGTCRGLLHHSRSHQTFRLNTSILEGDTLKSENCDIDDL